MENFFWKEIKIRKGKGHGSEPSVMYCSNDSHLIIAGHHVIVLPFVSYSYPLPSVWSGWPWSPKSRSSHLKIRLSFLLLWNVECPCTEKWSLPHILLVTTCFSLFKTWIKCIRAPPSCCGPVFETLLSSGFSMTECARVCLGISECPNKEKMWWAGWWR